MHTYIIFIVKFINLLKCSKKLYKNVKKKHILDKRKQYFFGNMKIALQFLHFYISNNLCTVTEIGTSIDFSGTR